MKIRPSQSTDAAVLTGSSEYHRSLARQIASRATPVLATSGLLLSGMAQAATFNVGSGDAVALAQAITDANANTEADTIVLDGSTFTFDGVTPATFSAEGDNALPSITSEITIEGNGSIIERDGTAPSFRLIHTATSGDLTLNDLTLQGGRATGGTVYARQGGGVFARGDLAIYDSQILNNYSIENGGGVNTQRTSVLTMARTRVDGNIVGEGSGAGIVTRSTGPTSSIRDSLVTNNQILSFSSAAGIAANNAVVANSTISGNSTEGTGGGVSLTSGSILINSTVTNNFAGFGGGGVLAEDAFSTVEIRNSLIAGNRADSGPLDCNESSGVFGPANIVGTGNNIDSDGSCATAAGSNFTTVADASTVLEPTLADNGGPTQTHALVTGSPAIDGGEQAQCDSDGVITDQRGELRPQDGDADNVVACDIGAFEVVEAPLTTCTRQAIQDKIDTGTASITFDCNGPAPDQDRIIQIDTQLLVDNGEVVTINGVNTTLDDFSNDIVLDATAINSDGDTSNDTRIVFLTGFGTELTLQNLTLTGGRADNGGAVDVFSDASLNVIGSTISNSTATITGGGISIRGNSEATITNSTIVGNTAQTGGGVYCQDTTITNSTITANMATTGGGVRCGETTIDIVHSTLTGNTGGGFSTQRGNNTITNTIIANNPGGNNCDPNGEPIIAQGQNVSDDASCGTTNVMVVTDAEIGPLANNGGPTQTHLPAANSPAIDAATGCMLDDDQRGETRPVDLPDADEDGEECDIGAVERQSADVPEIAFSMAEFDVAEDDGNVTVTLTRSGGDGEASADVVLTGTGTATAGDDFNNSSFPVTVSFATGVTSRDISIPITDDTLAEGPENFDLGLTDFVNSAAGTQDETTVNIGDDDTEVLFDTTAASLGGVATVPENIGTQVVPGAVMLSNAVVDEVTVDITFDALNSTATLGTDFNFTPMTITFAAGQTVADVTVEIIDDNIIEPDETAKVDLANAATSGTGTVTIVTPDTFTVTIADNDVADDEVADADDDDDCSGAEYLIFCAGSVGPGDTALLLFFALVALWRREIAANE